MNALLSILRTTADRLNGTLWFVPALCVVATVTLGTALTLGAGVGESFDPVLFVGDLEAARGLMTALASATITVTGLVFTLTVVALQVASGQYSPRLLSNFLRDTGNKVVLSAFLGTFAYALAVLRSLPADADADVPRLAITVGMILAAGSLSSLVWFIDHLAQSIRVETILLGAVTTSMSTIERVLPDPDDANRPAAVLPDIPEDAQELVVDRRGYIQAYAVDAMYEQVIARGASVRLVPKVGAYVVQGARLGWWWPADDQDVDAEALAEDVRANVDIGPEPTNRQDIGFGLQQAVDVAARALSPGVNDPTTAVQAIDYLAGPLAELARRRIGPIVRADDDGRVRVGIDTPDFEDYLDLICGQPRRYGADEPTVILALLSTLAEAARATTSADRRDLIDTQIRIALADAERMIAQPHDLERLRALAEQVTHQPER